MADRLRLRRKVFKVIQHPLSLPQKSIFPPGPALREQRCLDFFFRVTVPLLNQNVTREIWDDIQSNVIAEDTSLKDSVVALSLQHMRFAQSRCDINERDVWIACSEAYSCALLSFALLLSRPQFDCKIAAQVCLLLVIFESLGGNKSALRHHLRAGLALVSRTSHDTGLRDLYQWIGVNTVIQSHDPSLLTALRGAFEDQNLTLSSPSDLIGLCRRTASLVTEVYRFALDSMLDSMLGTARCRQAQTYTQQKLLAPFADAERHMQEYILDDRNDKSMRLVCQTLYAILLVARILLACCTTRYQTTYDKCLPQFSQAIDLCKPYLYQKKETHLFALDPGIICTLQLIGVLCRDARKRRAAVDLLMVAPQREGVWYASDSRALVEAVIEFEERDAEVFDDDGWCSLVPEERRIHLARFAEPNGWLGDRKVAQLLYKPHVDQGFVEQLVVLQDYSRGRLTT